MPPRRTVGFGCLWFAIKLYQLALSMWLLPWKMSAIRAQPSSISPLPSLPLPIPSLLHIVKSKLNTVPTFARVIIGRHRLPFRAWAVVPSRDVCAVVAASAIVHCALVDVWKKYEFARSLHLIAFSHCPPFFQRVPWGDRSQSVGESVVPMYHFDPIWSTETRTTHAGEILEDGKAKW